jgi:iron complex outermembrane recepter protein
MFRSQPRLIALALATPFSLFVAAGQAAVLEEVTVTAQKRAQSVQDVGIAITAYSGDQLEQLGFTNAQQVTSMAPGVQTIQPNGEANYAVAIRGVVANDFTTNVESPVALYIDEVYISQMSGAGFMLYDMERVEILRGPQGTLFGRNATGGLVHYITRKPTEDFNGYIKGTYGDYDQYKLEGAVGGGNEWVAARFSGTYLENDGYVTNRLDKSTDLNNADDQAYRAQLLITPTDDLEILFNVRHGEQDIDTGFFENVSSVEPQKLTPNTLNPVLEYLDNDGDVFAGDYDDPGYNDLETNGYTGTVKWIFDNVTLTSITDYSTTERKYIEDSDASPAPVFNFFLNTDAEQFSQEIRLDGATDNIKWVAGLYYLGLDIDDSNGAITDPFVGPAVYDALEIPRTPGSEAGFNNPYTSELDSYSAFGQLEYALTDTLNLVVGARYIQDEKDFEYSTNAVEFLDPEQRNYDAPSNLAQPIELGYYKGSRKDEEWSGRLQLDWALSDDLLVYAGWNRGVRGGGFNAPLLPLDPPFEYDDITMSYDPEQLDAFEVGFKGTYFDGLMRLNGAAYYYDYKDYQAFFIAGLQTITFNTDADSQGFELELISSPIDGLDILLGAAYNDIELDARKDIPVQAPAGPSVKAPEWNLNALVRYEWPMFGGYVAAQGDIVYIDEHIFALTGAETVTEDGYSVSNVSLTYTTEDRNWEVSAFVDNVTDEEYLVQTFDLSGLDNFGMTEQYYGRPRWWGVSLKYSWGE